MSAPEGTIDAHKQHRERKGGRKADKKKVKKKANQDDDPKHRNPKAFTFNSAIKAERRFRRKQDIETKKQHIPLVDRTPVEPPPILVAVVGPPKVGKSLVIQCLIKSYTKHPLTNIMGPVTLVSGKRRRITFIECNNDINSMIDIAKVADLVLLLIDASFGFEMEIFEFLNICQVHGMPRIMGVLTHLDMIKNAKQMRKTKKTLKQRFWTEVYAGAKLFYLSGLLHNEYLRMEVKNLARFISVMKFRPLTWRTTHPYMLVDRIEDLTDPELVRKNTKVDRTVTVYGYVRGVPLNKHCSIHIPGCGDMKIKDISFLPDPCPLPEQLKKRALVERERLIYAPFSGVGGIVYDKDAVYVELGGSHSHTKDDTGLVSQLLQTQETLDRKLEQSELQLFTDSAPIKSQDVKEIFKEEKVYDQGRIRRKWKRNISERAREAFLDRQEANKNIQRVVYGIFDEFENRRDKEEEQEDKGEELAGIFRVVQAKQKQKLEDRELKNLEESVFFSKDPPCDWLAEDNKPLLVNRFVTGKWKESEDAEELLKLNELEEDVYGDFEDLETGEKHKADQTKKASKTSEAKSGENAPKEMNPEEMDERKQLMEKKRKLKEQFDAEYDTTDKSFYDDLKQEVERQAELNKSEFEGMDDGLRVTLEGYRPGMYVRLEIDRVPCELVINHDPNYPMIVGGLLPGEENIGYVQTRIKKHRWYPKILKSKDPIILSVGWRRFQTLAIYSKLEDNMRNRMLKYTPEHVACMAHFWGPITPQSTGILAVQDVSKRDANFRIAATGSIVELDKSTRVVKKLKLTGVPYKIFKKSAFIKDMFNSRLEVAKFEGARIKTVSGIRGQIKKAVSRPEGCFRATFEDKIQLSDIVFCRTWYKVDVPKFYNPVTSLLLPSSEKSQWSGMKTVGQLKRENNIRTEVPNADHLYTPIERQPKVFKPLAVPRGLQKELPYRDKPKLPGSRKVGMDQKRVAVVREPREENIAKLMKMIRTNYAHKQETLKEATHKRITDYQKRVEFETAKKLKRQKELKKQVFRDLSKLEAKKKKKGF
ncbi:hypothetical protein QAD02_000997 [Eretmocerus hayati]|uniref:Uncharacterized protein n=1 Tax=Eretmocerus hayati TaxID=131215 RepID=A0ACC2NG18_9HYME|nr:hypothetical protein QAD02_000997 [Eretmocerus hayati]